ncbi:MAG: lipid-A-disaccharide synthase [Rickettsiales bacterium]|nr:lipid-A-disaccharide synthase [Rickettsiales bacterium]
MALKIFIIAGEASGDRLGAKLMRELKAQSKERIDFCGVGGHLMEKEGLKSLFPIAQISLMGFVEIIPHIFKIYKLILHTATMANLFQPNIVITIDSPGFCFRVIKHINKPKKTQFVHYVSPSVWAYKKERVNFIAKYYDLLLSILPFEPKYYKNTNLSCEYIGHPISEDGWDIKVNKLAIKKQYDIDPKSKILGIMAGSRKSEVQTLLPIFIESINQFLESDKNITAIFPTTSESLTKLIKAKAKEIKCNTKIIPIFQLSETERIKLLKSFDAAIVKSGTSSLELTFASVPMLVAYKVNFITSLIVKYVFQILKNLRFASLTNILLNKEVIPEYIQENCVADKISAGLKKLFFPKFISKQHKDYKKILRILSNKDNILPSKKAAAIILNRCKNT